MDENHSLNIEQCKRVTATGVSSVDSFSDKQIVLSFAGGKIVIAGSGMKITGFLKSSGSFSAAGEIYGAKYVKKFSLKQRLFK